MEPESSLEKQDFPFGHDNGKELKRGRFDDTRRNDALLHEAVVGGYLDTVRMLIGAVRIFFIPNSHSHLFNKHSYYNMHKYISSLYLLIHVLISHAH